MKASKRKLDLPQRVSIGQTRRLVKNHNRYDDVRKVSSPKTVNAVLKVIKK